MYVLERNIKSLSCRIRESGTTLKFPPSEKDSIYSFIFDQVHRILFGEFFQIDAIKIHIGVG